MSDADAIVVGAGPNGLVAANRLADAGWSVQVLEAQPEPGGAVRSSEALEAGFVTDHCSAFYPLAAASPAIAGLGLERHGLRWLHGPLVLAHPAGDGSCVSLSRDLAETASSLDAFALGDGASWRRLHALWRELRPAALDLLVTPLPAAGPALRLLATLGPARARDTARLALLSARRLGEEHFAGDGGRRLLAGCALHADLTPETALGGFFGFLLSALGQDVGFPVPAGGAGALSGALVARLRERGGALECDARVERILVRRGRAAGVRTADGRELGARRAVLAAVDAPQLYLRLLERDDVPAAALADVRRFEWDWGTVKLDWTLDGPIPWSAPDARRAPVVHVADGVDALTLQSSQLRMGLVPERPFLVVGQYSPVDASRQPPGKEVAWAYAHVPQHVHGDAGGGLTGAWDAAELDELAARCELELERLAPGFGALVRRRRALGPHELQAADESLAGGALNGGSAQLHQQLFLRPASSFGRPGTPIRGLYLASASAHPGGGVHGGPGAIAARAALREERSRRALVALGVAAGAAAAAGRQRRRARTSSRNSRRSDGSSS